MIPGYAVQIEHLGDGTMKAYLSVNGSRFDVTHKLSHCMTCKKPMLGHMGRCERCDEAIIVAEFSGRS